MEIVNGGARIGFKKRKAPPPTGIQVKDEVDTKIGACAGAAVKIFRRKDLS